MIPTEATPQIVDWILIIGAIVGMHLVLAESPIRKSNSILLTYASLVLLMAGYTLINPIIEKGILMDPQSMPTWAVIMFFILFLGFARGAIAYIYPKFSGAPLFFLGALASITGFISITEIIRMVYAATH